MKPTLWIFAVLILACMPCSGQDFKIDDYHALALIGPPGLDNDTQYVSFAGDFGFAGKFPDEGVVERQVKQESGLLSRFNLRVINFEFMFEGGNGRASDRIIDQAAMQILKKTGFNLIARANNHALDFGLDGIRYNTKALQDAGFPTIGTTEIPMYLWPADGSKIAIYAVTDYTDKEDREHAILNTSDADIDLLRKQSEGAAFRIAFIHLGSISVFPSPHEKAQVVRLIESGADLVICTGSHFFKGYATVEGKPVIYGTGNHLFSYEGEQTEPVGLHAVAGFKSGKLTQLFVVPFRNSIFQGDVGPLDETGFASFKRTFLERSSPDPDKYFTDPSAWEGLKSTISSLSLSSLKDLRVRHLRYGALIVFHTYPIASVLGVVLLLIFALVIGRRILVARMGRRREAD